MKMNKRKKFLSSAHMGKKVGVTRMNKQGIREFEEGEVVGYHRTGKHYLYVISKDGFFHYYEMGTAQGRWMIAWVGEKPELPKMEAIEAEPRKKDKVTHIEITDEDREAFIGLEEHGIEDVMAKNIKKKRGRGRPPKAQEDKADADMRFFDYGCYNPSGVDDLTSGLSLGIGCDFGDEGDFGANLCFNNEEF